MTVAAMQMGDMKVWAQRSQLVWTSRQSLILPNIFSTRSRWRLSARSWGMGTLRFAFEGMHGVMPRSIRALRNQSATYSRSPSKILALGKASVIRPAPL